MEKDIIKEICEDLKWYERIIVKLFSKIFINIYKLGVKKGFRWGSF